MYTMENCEKEKQLWTRRDELAAAMPIILKWYVDFFSTVCDESNTQFNYYVNKETNVILVFKNWCI